MSTNQYTDLVAMIECYGILLTTNYIFDNT